MTVSVVIPLYNKAPYIQRALGSVLGQTFHDFDVIVVDDGSTDGSANIVRQCTDSRVRLISQKNAGPGAARNRGIREVKTELVAFLDADDEWRPTFIQENIDCFRQYQAKVNIVCADSIIHETGERSLPARQRAGLREGVLRLTPDMPWEHAVAILHYLQWGKTLSRTSCVRKWGGFFDREIGANCGEDLWLSFKVVLNEPIAINFNPLHIYHTEASELATHAAHRRKGMRPIMPFLLYPEEIEATCPIPLRRHLKHMFAPFALSAANYLGALHQFKQGRDILNRFDCLSFVTATDYIGAWLRTSRMASVPLDAVRALKQWRPGADAR
jgi:glycosyltransferase involved in cell wall biosynthesis